MLRAGHHRRHRDRSATASLPPRRRRATTRFDRLRGRDIHHRVDHILGDVGDLVGSARARGGRTRGSTITAAAAIATAAGGEKRA